MVKKLDKTLADYVVGGVMPALLIGLLVSLCYFLLELAMPRQDHGQLNWVLFFFIVGTVLIARIAMRGDIGERAGVYGIALAIAAGLALVRFVEIPQTALGGLGWLIPISLMSVIWWSAHKLTLDSTWDEDTGVEDAGGLFDSVPEEEAPAETAKAEAKQDWFGQLQAERHAEQQRKKPGIMVVYFSLAALPLFGLGQALLPATDVARRRYAFWLLTLYVACGLGMLLTTSFLGLRRYLRGRRLQMPAAMTGMWLGLGTALILTLMVLSAYFLPRPEAEYHLSQLLGWAKTKERDANRTHVFEGSHGKSDESGDAAGKTEQQGGGDQTRDRRDQGRRSEQQGRQGNPSSREGEAGDRNARSGRDRSGQAKSGGNQGNQQGNQGDRQGNQGGGSNSKNGQGKDQRGPGDKTGSQGNGSGAKDKTGEKQPGQRGEQDTNSKDGSGGQTPDKRGEKGDQEQGEDQGRENAKDRDKRDNPPEAGREQHKNEDRQGNRDGQSEQQKDQGSGNNSPPPPPPPQPQASTMNWDWLNWIVWALLIGGVLFALWKWGKQLWNALLQIWREIRAWWQGLFGGSETQAEEDIPDPESNLPPQPFAWFSNPLLTPTRFKSMEEMIRYSFAALHSWAYEQNLGRQPDETPAEFVQRLGHYRQRVHQDLRKLADLYAVVTYARVQPPSGSEAILRNFWNRLSEEPLRPVVVN